MMSLSITPDGNCATRLVDSPLYQSPVAWGQIIMPSFFQSGRMMAIVERDLRKFFRSPALMVAAMVFPLVQLIVLGNAFGGKINDAKLGIVSHDTGPQAIRVIEALRAVQSNARTFQPIVYTDEQTMVAAVRRGDLNAGLVIPPQFSRDVYEQTRPRIGLVLDNTDNFMTSTFEDQMDDRLLRSTSRRFSRAWCNRSSLRLLNSIPTSNI